MKPTFPTREFKHQLEANLRKETDFTAKYWLADVQGMQLPSDIVDVFWLFKMAIALKERWALIDLI